ncbi:MAG: Unknown protein [uncultured Sulfurovum sp.]|uniref:Uncharacterized protein n=1 Tax=uncultured Sulfurovum sp. TaxID=269237 RepID=A0A6S6TSA9_9BACT|nr:MAG: Unknown protein [uncultured Sulfurovum sp.]
MGVLLLLISACKDLKPHEPIDNDIAKHENILEEFDKLVQSSNRNSLLSLDVLPVENKTGSSHERINQLQLIPQKELKKIKIVNPNDTASEYVIKCVVIQFDSTVKYVSNYMGENARDRSKRDCQDEIRSQIDEIGMDCTLINRTTGNALSKVWSSNFMAVTNKRADNKLYFKFKGSGFDNSQHYTEHDNNITKGLNFLVDVSLIELISKLKGYPYQKISTMVRKSEASIK